MNRLHLLHFIRAATVAGAMIATAGLPNAHAAWHGGGGGWHGGGGGGWGWHGGGGWGGWHGGGCCGWGWGFGFAFPPIYVAPPAYYYPPAYYAPPPPYYPPQYGAYGYGSYEPEFRVVPPVAAQTGFGAHAGLDPNNCGTPDEPRPCPHH